MLSGAEVAGPMGGWDTEEVWDGSLHLAPHPPCCPAPSIQQSYQFPDDVGISIGTPLDPQWIRLEVHYSNFHNLPGERLERLGKNCWAGCLMPLGAGRVSGRHAGFPGPLPPHVVTVPCLL